MLILLIIIFAIIGVIVTIKTDNYSSTPVLYWTFFGTLLIIVVPILMVCYPYNISERLAMYEEENIKIEEKVKSTVQG